MRVNNREWRFADDPAATKRGDIRGGIAAMSIIWDWQDCNGVHTSNRQTLRRSRLNT